MKLAENNQYKIVINRVLDYIHSNLSGDLSLEKLASVAGYSPFHFQRLFNQIVGESPKQYIIRLRLEKVAHFFSVFPNLNISELSYDSGFSSLSTFSRAFKSYFGVSPDEYKNLSKEQVRKICKTNSKKGKIGSFYSSEFRNVNFSQADFMDLENKVEISVRKEPEKQMVFIQTCLDTPDSITEAFRKLCMWAEPRGLLTPQTQFIGILLDIPFITLLEKCRFRACITVNSELKEKKEIGKLKVNAGIFASYEFKGDIYASLKSLIYFKHHWLDSSGYELGDITGLEVFSENPALKPAELIRRNILIPIKPAK
jgi:AraC family transcriptional regulator